jgi:hypothetical protein
LDRGLGASTLHEVDQASQGRDRVGPDAFWTD